MVQPELLVGYKSHIRSGFGIADAWDKHVTHVLGGAVEVRSVVVGQVTLEDFEQGRLTDAHVTLDQHGTFCAQALEKCHELVDTLCVHCLCSAHDVLLGAQLCARIICFCCVGLPVQARQSLDRLL